MKLVVQTRSPDVVRDADPSREIVDGGGQVQVNLTVTTDDEDVRRAFEPACPSNARLGCAAGDVMERYRQHYRAARAIPQRKLPSLGEGKDGFRPPS